MSYKPVNPKVNFNDLEKEILNFWRTHNTFEKSLEGKNKNFSFYDGPPFATGLPHYGHILAGVLKDVVPRYWTMKGYKVPRQFGWDCHGLPVENEVNKMLGLKSRKEILNFGVDKYNETCRSIVQRYAQEWKETINRVGRWVDMEKPYFTMDEKFMESVWWVFQELYKQGLIYEGFKVVPYSVGISSVLSNFEANQNYQDTQDPALTVKFLTSQGFLLAWTTTPWTLPSNLALGVNAKDTYCQVEYNQELFWVTKNQVSNFFKENFTVKKEVLGEELVGLNYEPLFPYFKDNYNSFKVLSADFVSDSSGTGVVHLAPGFGEDDFYVCQKNQIPLVVPVNDDGEFTSDVVDFSGLKVKEADKEIIKFLKQKQVIFRHENITHSYPFCYRTNTPLIYKAVSSWFVKVEAIKEKMLKNNKETSWNPSHLRDNRFHNWLEQARDWAISRNRFWGTPLPIWKNSQGEVVCIGSKEELEQLTGEKVSDLHSHFISHLTIASKNGGEPLTWVGGVLDCWFESGSMPYAQHNYPHNSEKFNAQFPADFIAEGLDQTRGWFYTLMVLSSALFDKAPFKNVIVNGLVLAEDGKKMSKSLKNYPDPMEVIQKHGADALRLYLLDSPVVRAEELKFSEKGVSDQLRKNLLRLYNSYSFYVNYANIDKFSPMGVKSDNPLDQWILSRLNQLTLEVNSKMENYEIGEVVSKFSEFIEDLTNTYIRFNRVHFWDDKQTQEKLGAYETLYEVLMTFSKLLAPFAPFLSEEIYQNLKKPTDEESVHLCNYPQGDSSLVNPELEKTVNLMMNTVELSRYFREKIKVKAKIPLKKLVVIYHNQSTLDSLKSLESYFKEEMNIKEILYSTKEEEYVKWQAKANFKALGLRFKAKVQDFAKAISSLSQENLQKFSQDKTLFLLNEQLNFEEVSLVRQALQEDQNLIFNEQVILHFDSSLSQEQIDEGWFRELMRKIQETRKAQGLNLSDKISLELDLSTYLKTLVNNNLEVLKKEALAQELSFELTNPETALSFEVEEEKFKVAVKKV